MPNENGAGEDSTRDLQRLLDMVERYNLYHVKTLHYSDVRSVMEWLGVDRNIFPFRHVEDTVTELNRYFKLHKARSVEVTSINEDPRMDGIDRLVVHIKQDCNSVISSSKSDAVILFQVIPCTASAPYCQELIKAIRDTQELSRGSGPPVFPTFANYPHKCGDPNPQQAQPDIDGFMPLSYKTTEPKAPAALIDNFGRRYDPLPCTAEANNPWSVYADTAAHREGKCEFDIEELITTPCKVAGRGGFGVTVSINDQLVVKTSLFPEMVNWSVPFINKEFNRYAHIATQVEEIMIGVLIKHPNDLRTLVAFGATYPDTNWEAEPCSSWSELCARSKSLGGALGAHRWYPQSNWSP
ncbi:hypothetical protein DPEC_G00256190 [Dallia pectoralis]|uniref:Uncharacterized protein n=1 Tax=Dallia pectoralis TaxID=75939 RepID=A0ACC2FUF7_DALPE|nr:hypothetical protein DPEC_G00256190 [Dallia pectoralis]